MPSSSDAPQPEESEDYVPDHGLPKLSRLNVALLTMSILSISAALYLSPVGQTATAEVRESVADSLPGTSDLLSVDTTPSASASATPTTSASAGAAATTAAGVAAASSAPTVGAGTPPFDAGAGLTGAGTSSGSGGSGGSGTGTRHHLSASTVSSSTSTTVKAKTKCWQFTWQQDAQKVYVANLSDPYGLDGAVGPYNGDGLACSDLPVDPSRAASTAVGAYVAPTPSTATKKALVSPAKDYFGFSQDGIPGDTSMVKALATKADKAPSAVGWFSSWDTAFRSDLVTTAWSNGELPVITWMPVATTTSNSYSLSRIIDGDWDTYLRRYAGAVVRTNLPVAIRFAHEMNGNWYGWSAGMTSYNNTPEKYVAAWRHIWQVFDEVGANDDVIWLWSPNRVDDLHPTATNGLTSLADDYPGDAYVDWVGASVYMRTKALGPTYASSFGNTVAALKALTDKPIFFAETAAVQSDGTTDLTTVKAQWIRNMLAQFAVDDRIVGFLWFNNIASVAVNGVEVNNDWRVDSSPDALAAFQAGISSSSYASGVLAD